MFELRIKLDLGQKVYYMFYRGLHQGATVEQGVIRGFQIRKTKEGFSVGVDFKGYNNIPIELVSENKEEIQLMANRYNSKTIEERYN